MRAVFILYFFFDPECSHCVTMRPVIDSLLADSLQIVGVVQNPYWIEHENIYSDLPLIMDDGSWEIIAIPTLVLYAKVTKNIYIVAQGETSLKETQENIGRSLYIDIINNLEKYKEYARRNE